MKTKYAVVSYWHGGEDGADIWLYDSWEEANDALKRLWKKSFSLAMEDEDFDEESSYCEDDVAEVAWKSGTCRYFEVVSKVQQKK